MSYLSEAHQQWHMIHGHDTVCPLDCGVGEAEAEADYYASLSPEELAEIQGAAEQDHVEEDPAYWAHYGFDVEVPF